MNCVKCGAALEEGSTSTLCPACQALETPPSTEPVDVPAVPPMDEPTPSAEPTITPDPSPTPEPPVEEPTPPENDVPGGAL